MGTALSSKSKCFLTASIKSLRKMKKNYLFFLFLSSFYMLNAQLTVKVDGIKENDSITVIVQKGAEQLHKKYAKYNNGNTSSVDFSLDSGEWAVKLDATGYTYPSQKVIEIPTVTSVLFTLTEASQGNYSYNWVDDGSAAGHSTQSYIAEPTEIVVLNDTVNVPIKKKKVYPDKNSLDINIISKGYYIFKLSNGKEQISKKVLKR